MKTLTVSKPAWQALSDARSFAPPFVGELLDEAYESRGGFRQITYEDDQRDEVLGLIQFVVTEEWEIARREAVKYGDGVEAVAYYIYELDAILNRM